MQSKPDEPSNHVLSSLTRKLPSGFVVAEDAHGSIVSTIAALILVTFAAAWPAARASEPGCFRTPSDAAAQTGARSPEGFRAEDFRRDLFTGAVWAKVRSCLHPERPGLLILAASGAPAQGRFAQGNLDFIPGTRLPVSPESAVRVVAVLAGARVSALETGEMVQLETPAIAESNGAIGERIKLRLIPLDSGTRNATSYGFGPGEYQVTGIVRSSRVVELVAR